MAKKINETGNKYGRLKVVERAESIKGNAAWLCRCDCGNEKVVLGALLRNGNTVSCGCKKAERIGQLNFVDETGNRYGRLTVLRVAGQNEKQNYLWECRCDCGNIHVVHGVLLRDGRVKSCGCLKAEWAALHKTTHGMAKKGKRHPLYSLWTGMKTRCHNSNEPCWDNYGGRGIRVCDEWQNFEPFYEWAIANGYRKGVEIDRRDNDGDYSPSNCRFVTRKTNARNKRNNRHVTINCKTKTLAEWAEISGLNPALLLYRLREGWDDAEILAPAGHYHNYKNPRQA